MVLEIITPMDAKHRSMDVDTSVHVENISWSHPEDRHQTLQRALQSQVRLSGDYRVAAEPLQKQPRRHRNQRREGRPALRGHRPQRPRGGRLLIWTRVDQAKSCCLWAKPTPHCHGILAPRTQLLSKSKQPKHNAQTTPWSCKVATLVLLIVQALLPCPQRSLNHLLAKGLDWELLSLSASSRV